METIGRKVKGTETRRAQTSFEYLLLIAASLILLVMIIMIIQTNLFKPNQIDIANKSDVIHGMITNVTNSTIR